MHKITHHFFIFSKSKPFCLHADKPAPLHFTNCNLSFFLPLRHDRMFAPLECGSLVLPFAFRTGKDLVIRKESPILSSSSIIAVAVGGVLLLLLIIDFVCCLTLHIGMIATLCRRTKRSPSELDEETKIGR